MMHVCVHMRAIIGETGVEQANVDLLGHVQALTCSYVVHACYS